MLPVWPQVRAVLPGLNARRKKDISRAGSQFCLGKTQGLPAGHMLVGDDPALLKGQAQVDQLCGLSNQPLKGCAGVDKLAAGFGAVGVGEYVRGKEGTGKMGAQNVK